MYKVRQLAEMLNVSTTLIFTWERQGYLPPPDKKGYGRAWRRETVRKFFRDKKVRIAYV